MHLKELAEGCKKKELNERIYQRVEDHKSPN